MIKTKRGYHSITNGFVTWHFYEQAVASMLRAFIDGDMDKVDELCILKVNNDTGLYDLSNWDNVTSEFELCNQIKRDRLASRG